jgi:hypothetical protein
MSRVLLVQSNPVYGACEEHLSRLIRGLPAESVLVALRRPHAWLWKQRA